MAQLVIAAAGAAVGSAFGPIGTQIGWALGSVVGAQFGPKQRTQGPRLEDLKITGAEYGQPIPWGAGHPRVAGQIWWASDRREISTSTSQGKGGGAVSTTYTYECDILYGLLDREIDYVARIWLNGKLIWTAHVDSDIDSITNSVEVSEWQRLTVYTGAADQMPDPTYDAAVTNAPAYRGRGTVFIEGLQLGNSGVIPNLTFEVVVDGTLTYVDKGFLSQWEVMTGANTVEATLGPDPILSGSSALTTSPKKWGTGSLHIPAGSTVLSPATIETLATGKAWRVETWMYLTAHPTQTFEVRDSSTTTVLNLVTRSDAAGAGFVYTVTSPTIGFTSSVVGDPADRPALNTWVHIAIEQPLGQPVRLFTSGGADIELGANLHEFGNSSFQQLVFSSSAERWVDSTLIRWFDADETDLLYSVGGYSVPTGPFEPPPYAYTIVDPNDDTIQNVVEDLCARAGMPAGTYDASALASITKPVRALAVSQVTNARAVLEQLMSAYFFEGYCTDKLYLVPRGGSSVDTIDADYMGAEIA